MNTLILVVSIIMMFIGIYLMLVDKREKNFLKKLKQDDIYEYKKVIGKVICAAYRAPRSIIEPRSVTPVVEYTVNGETYEAINRTLEIGGELPVGTQVVVWYKEDDPKQAILDTQVNKPTLKNLFGMILICLGMTFMFVVI